MSTLPQFRPIIWPDGMAAAAPPLTDRSAPLADALSVLLGVTVTVTPGKATPAGRSLAYAVEGDADASIEFDAALAAAVLARRLGGSAADAPWTRGEAVTIAAPDVALRIAEAALGRGSVTVRPAAIARQGGASEHTASRRRAGRQASSCVSGQLPKRHCPLRPAGPSACTQRRFPSSCPRRFGSPSCRCRLATCCGGARAMCCRCRDRRTQRSSQAA